MSEHSTAQSPHTDSISVYHWPEFKALCRRLGIAYELPTTALTIELRGEDNVKITHEYHGKDMGAEYPPRVQETTTEHNEKFRTWASVGEEKRGESGRS